MKNFVKKTVRTCTLPTPQIVVLLKPIKPELTLPFELTRLGYVVSHEPLNDIAGVHVNRSYSTEL